MPTPQITRTDKVLVDGRPAIVVDDALLALLDALTVAPENDEDGGDYVECTLLAFGVCS